MLYIFLGTPNQRRHSSLDVVKCPKSIDFMAELPRHDTGKLYKRLLKDKYWAEAKA